MTKVEELTIQLNKQRVLRDNELSKFKEINSLLSEEKRRIKLLNNKIKARSVSNEVQNILKIGITPQDIKNISECDYLLTQSEVDMLISAFKIKDAREMKKGRIDNYLSYKVGKLIEERERINIVRESIDYLEIVKHKDKRRRDRVIAKVHYKDGTSDFNDKYLAGIRTTWKGVSIDKLETYFGYTVVNKQHFLEVYENSTDRIF